MLMNKDAGHHPELTERQLAILSALVRAYTQRPEPVSSKQIVEEYGLNVSSATVRNELVILEQLGMIKAPHTSAGRIPTEEGYRYFVQSILQQSGVGDDAPEETSIRAELDYTMQDVQKLARTAANVLARSTNAAALVTEPRSLASRFRHVQLISTYGHLVLMVLVLDGGDVLQQMLTLNGTVDQERLTQISNMINATCKDDTSDLIRQKARTRADVLEQEIMELMADVLRDATQNRNFAIHTYGFSNILPEFEDKSIGAQQALRILEGSPVFTDVISETIEKPDEPAVRVLVGGEGKYNDISHLGIVIGRYGTGQLTGAITVLGPTRMRYGRAISTVRYISTLMSAIMKDVYGSDERE